MKQKIFIISFKRKSTGKCDSCRVYGTKEKRLQTSILKDDDDVINESIKITTTTTGR